MKFEVLKDKFSNALSTSLKAISVKASLPILQNFLIESDEGRLKIVATDLDKSVITWVGAKIEGEGSITVPAKALHGFVSSLKDDQIKGEIVDDNLLLKTDTTKATFNGTSSEEYPSVDYSISENHIQIDPKMLKRAVDETYFSSSDDDSRPAWTGILLKSSEEGSHLQFVGLDGFRLSKKHLPFKDIKKMKNEFEEVIVPAKNFLEVIRLASKAGDNIKMDFQPSKSTVVFDLDDLFFVSKTLEGEFPDYNSVIPDDHVLSFSVSYDEFLNAVKISSVFAKENNAVRLSVDTAKKQMTLFTDDVELGSHTHKIKLDNIEGEDLELAFKVSYLLDYLNNVPSEEIIVKCSGQSSPALFHPSGRDDYIHVAVPLQPYWEE